MQPVTDGDSYQNKHTKNQSSTNIERNRTLQERMFPEQMTQSTTNNEMLNQDIEMEEEAEMATSTIQSADNMQLTEQMQSATSMQTGATQRQSAQMRWPSEGSGSNTKAKLQRD